MADRLGINDLTLMPLAWRDGRLTVLSENDPLLRRFGQCDYLRLAAGASRILLRKQADEIWTLVSGRARLVLTDQREDSPSRQSGQTLELDENAPRSVLIPFGVHARITATADAVFVRLTTHADDFDPGDLVP